MNAPLSTGSSFSAPRWVWPTRVERRALAAERAVALPGDGQIVRYTLPERLLGPEPADCEVVLGDDYGARVLGRALRRESWWLWWTERPLLARLERLASGLRRARHLPESMLEAPREGAARVGDVTWTTRGLFRGPGAALLPPDSPLQSTVLEAGAGIYSERDPNFWIGVSPSRRWSPRALEEWCANAVPSSLSLDPFALGAERLCMLHDGDISISIPEAEAPAVLAALEQWASPCGVTLELQAAPEAP